MANRNEVKSRIKRAVVECLESTDVQFIKVADVSHGAGISRSSFYRYYESVDDVVKEIEEDVLSSIREINSLALTQMHVNGEESEAVAFNLARTSRVGLYAGEVRALIGPHGDPQFSYKAQKTIREYLVKKLAVMPDSFTKSVATEFMTAGFYHAINYWVREHDEVDAEAFTLAMREGMRIVENVLSASRE